MPISQGVTTSFKLELLGGIHAFSNSIVRATTAPDTFKIALYTSAANLTPTTTTVYTTTNEVATGGGYVAGGNTLTTMSPMASGNVAYLDFDDTSWNPSSITANGALIYNSTQANRAVAILAFGGDKTSLSSPFTIQFPANDANNAIIRIA